MPVRLFVGNLPYSATEEDLREHLSTVAPPVQVVLPVDRETGRPRGFAFVDIADRALAEEAIRRFDAQDFKGRRLAVSEARAREDRPPGSRPPSPRPGWLGGPGGSAGMPRTPGDRSERSSLPNQAPQRRRAEPRHDWKEKADRGPKGPIRERTSGRFYALEDEPGSELPEFDNFATSSSEEQAGATEEQTGPTEEQTGSIEEQASSIEGTGSKDESDSNDDQL